MIKWDFIKTGIVMTVYKIQQQFNLQTTVQIKEYYISNNDHEIIMPPELLFRRECLMTLYWINKQEVTLSTKEV